MPRLITLCYRKIIDSTTAQPWEKLVFDATYQEYRLQAQTLDPTQHYRTFGELLHHEPRAEQLHFRVSAAVLGLVQQLGGRVPDITDNLGRRCLRFTQFRFEIINSDLRDATQHRVAINFFADPVVWHESVGGYLLLTDPAADAPTDGSTLTYLLALRPFLSIHALLPADGPALAPPAP